MLIVGVVIILAAALFSVVWKVIQKRPDWENPVAVENNGHNLGGAIAGFKIKIIPPAARVRDQVSITMMAVNRDGQAVGVYTGQVTIKSYLFDLPQRTSFLPGDMGQHEFRAIAVKAGTESIEVSDPAAGVHSESEPFTVLDIESPSPGATAEAPIATGESHPETNESPLVTGESPR